MVELQRGGQVEARAQFLALQRTAEGIAHRLRADARDRDRLDPMSDAVDVQPDLVTDRDVGDGGYLDVGVAGFRVRRQPGLRARLADRGDRDHFVLLHGLRDGGVSGAIADADLLPDLEAAQPPPRPPPCAVNGTLVEPAGS